MLHEPVPKGAATQLLQGSFTVLVHYLTEFQGNGRRAFLCSMYIADMASTREQRQACLQMSWWHICAMHKQDRHHASNEHHLELMWTQQI